MIMDNRAVRHKILVANRSLDFVLSHTAQNHSPHLSSTNIKTLTGLISCAIRHSMLVERNSMGLYFVPYGTKPHSYKGVFTNIKNPKGFNNQCR